MVSTHDETEPSIVWRLRDSHSFKRQLEQTFGAFPERERWLTQVLECFSERLQWHPREWPRASAPPSDYSFRFFGVDIRYRIFPQDETVEVTSITSILPPGRHPDATRTI
jgi:hypothetical protein